VAGGEQVEIGVADARDHGLVVLEQADEALGHFGAVEGFR
jgi:hypothetical protein